eukprot:c22457_g1_i1.p1 GENE.c22457_g1_i1~~c22457_g1_i1.p1  ORF type:complete len:147 (-),score=22.38 c22457_g1_i1:27-467(-)
MISSQAHPFFLRLINRLQDYNQYYFIPYLTVLLSTGSIFLSLEYCEYQQKNRINIIGRKMYASDLEKWVGHREGNSWHSWDVEYIFPIVLDPKKLFFGLFILVLFFIIMKRIFYTFCDSLLYGYDLVEKQQTNSETIHEESDFQNL